MIGGWSEIDDLTTLSAEGLAYGSPSFFMVYLHMVRLLTGQIILILIIFDIIASSGRAL